MSGIVKSALIEWLQTANINAPGTAQFDRHSVVGTGAASALVTMESATAYPVGTEAVIFNNTGNALTFALDGGDTSAATAITDIPDQSSLLVRVTAANTVLVQRVGGSHTHANLPSLDVLSFVDTALTPGAAAGVAWDLATTGSLHVTTNGANAITFSNPPATGLRASRVITVVKANAGDAVTFPGTVTNLANFDVSNDTDFPVGTHELFLLCRNGSQVITGSVQTA